MKRIILFLSLLSLSFVAYADNAAKVRNGMYISGAFSDMFYSAGLGYTFADTPNKFEEVFGTFGLGYLIIPNVTLWGGINYYITVDSPTNSRTHTEQHPYQQIVWSIVNRHKLSIASTTRLEERHNDNTNTWKFRYHQKFSIEFTDSILNKYSPIFYNETRFNLSHDIAIPENRTFGGVYIPTGPRSKLEFGYLNQQLFGKDNNAFVHNLVLNLKINTG